MIYADHRDIDAQINNLLNRNAEGTFSSVGDTSDSSDKRYSDETVTEARRKAAYKIFTAIGSDPSSPYWADLMALYAVNHNDPIPVHFGEIGLPLIAPNDSEIETHATGTLTVSAQSHAKGSLTVRAGSQGFATGYLVVEPATGNSTGTLTIRQGVQAVGTFFVTTSLPQAGDTLTVAGQTFIFYTQPVGEVAVIPGYIPVRSTRTAQATAIAQALQDYADTHPTSPVAAATYTSQYTVAIVTHKTYGTVGNTFAISSSNPVRVTASGANLAGGINGVQAGEIIYVNGFKCVWSEGPTDDVLYIGVPESDDAGTLAIQLVNALNGSHIAPIVKATFTANETTAVVTVTHNIAGAVGNLYELTDSSGGAITRSGDTLTGGTGGIIEGDQITIGNTGGVTFTFSNVNNDTPSNTYIPFSPTGDAEDSAKLITSALSAKTDVRVSAAGYTWIYPPVPGAPEPPIRNGIGITYNTAGTIGNSFGLGVGTGSRVTNSASTLTNGFSTGIVAGSLLVVNGITFTFVSSGATGNQINVGGSVSATASNIVSVLSASTNPSINVATYAAPVAISGGNYRIDIRFIAAGSSGNLFTLANSTGTNAGAILASGSSLTGGTVNIEEGDQITINGSTITFSYISGDDIPYVVIPGPTQADSATILASALTALINDTNLNVATYTASGNVITITYKTQGSVGNGFTLTNSTYGGIIRSAGSLSGGGVEDTSRYMTGVPADPDWIDSARYDLIGANSDYFGTGKVDHDGMIDSDLPSPLAGRYSTSNGVFKFTGARAKIPMIKVPSEDTAATVIDTDTGAVTSGSGDVTVTATDSNNIGYTLIAKISTTEVARGTISSVKDATTYSIDPYVATATGAVDITIIEEVPSAAQTMADTKIPLDLATLNVKLALPMICKEGDNLFRTAQWLGSEGERELLLLKAGAVKVAPINVEKMTRVGQQFNQ